MQIATERGTGDQMLVKCHLSHRQVVKKGKKKVSKREILLTSRLLSSTIYIQGWETNIS